TFEGAAELTRRRAQAGPVAILSAALTDEIQFGASKLGVRECVGKIISAEDTSVSKHDPEGYLMVIEWFRAQGGSAAQQALVIEDSVDGIHAAKRAGLVTIAVAHSYSRDVLEKTEADLVLDRLLDIDERKLSELYSSLFG